MPARGTLAVTLAAVLAAAVASTASASLPGRAQLVQDRAVFLAAAAKGAADARRLWWHGTYPWYDDTLNDTTHTPLARLWTAYPLFETLNSLARVQPTAARKAAVRSFAAQAEKYWNPNLAGGGGYAFYITVSDPQATAYFDDNGWWGLAFVDAYEATGQKRYLADAGKALHFIATQGWAPAGGTWWDTDHHYVTAEPLAAGALIASELYRITHRREYLDVALKFIAWGDSHSWNAQARLYARSPQDPSPMTYVEGMMVAAQVRLCQGTGDRKWCARAEALADASADHFPADADWAPQYDAIYLRTMLDLYDLDGNPRWYELAYRNAQRALKNAADERGLYLKAWDGSAYGPPGMLRTHAATISLFARLAQSAPPDRR